MGKKNNAANKDFKNTDEYKAQRNKKFKSDSHESIVGENGLGTEYTGTSIPENSIEPRDTIQFIKRMIQEEKEDQEQAIKNEETKKKLEKRGFKPGDEVYEDLMM
jgi:hypothetical protein